MLENLTDEECALYAITQDPSGIDLAEFCVYAPIDAETDGCFRARPYQVAWWRCTDTLQIDQCSRSVGKALHTVTKVPTPEGWTTMGDLVEGDVVFNEQGEPVDVLEVFDVMDNRPCFKVKFSDGSEIIADADHEWVVNSKNRRDKSKKTVTTQDLLGTSIDVAKPLVLDDKDYGILSPYLLGYWLGDGHSAGAMLTIGDEDYEDVEQILDSEGYFLDKLKGNILYAVRLNGIHDIWTELPVLDDPSFRPRKDSLTSGDVRNIRIRAKNGEGLRELASEFGIYPSSVTQFIRGEGRVSAGGPIRGDLVGFELNRILKKLNLHNNKRVPDSYMRGSESQRLALLQGLMDSDGHCRADGGRCEVTFKSELLARSVFELAVSLGQKPHIASKRARCNGVDAGIVWRVGFKPLDIQPFRIKRKADRVQTVTPLSRTKLTHRIVESVDPIVSVPVRCIRVSGPSSLFLVGDTMIPTHNSKSIQIRALAFPFLYPKQEMVVTAPELNHLQPIIGIIEEVFESTRLGREMLQKSRSRISHRPFIMNFANGARILGKIPQRDGKGVKGCAAEGTLVLTSNGMELIEDVKIGDSIFTHSGVWSQVKQITTDVNDCYEVKGQGSFPLTVSNDHRFYGRTESGEVTWVDVEDLMDEEFKWATPTEFPVLSVEDLKFHGTATRFKTVNSDSFWWLVGRYVADGHLTESKKTGKEKRVIWSVHPKDQAEVVKRLDDLSLGYRIVRRAHSTADLVILNSAPLHDWLEKHFSRRSHTKTLPAFVYGMDEVMRRNLLEGYLSGDGNWSASKNRWTAGTCSHKLAVGMQLLGQSIGFRVNVTLAHPKVDSIMGVKLKNEPRPSWRIMLYHDYMHEGWRFAPVKSVTPVGKKRVFNLITDDHSYMTGSIMSHNIHPIWLEQDEAQDYPHAGWTEIIETLRQGMQGAAWRAHGVTRGVQDDFYKRSADPKTEWTVHRIYAMHSPEWSDDVRRKKIAEYGSRDDPDYRRNVLGEHGDATNPLFVLNRLMRVIDTESESEYNTDEYNKCRVTAEILQDAGGDVEAVLTKNIPAPDPKIKTFWGGMDVGYTNDPSEILIFGEYQITDAERKLREKYGKKSPSDGESTLKLIARVQLVRVKASDQVRVISWLFKNFKGMKSFGMDATGNGLPLFQDMQDAAVGYVDAIKGYKFGSKIVVGFDEQVEFDEMIDDPADVAAVESIVEIYATDVLRTLVDQGRLWLPFDDSLLASFQGQMQVVKSDMDMYGKKRRYSSGNFHVLDAARMAILAWKQNPIEKLLGHQQQQDVIDMPMFDDFLEGW